MPKPEIKGVDNRGDEEVPFGWVYVDDTRVGFSIDQGQPVVFGAKFWKEPTEAQFKAAKAHLDEKLPNWSKRQEP